MLKIRALKLFDFQYIIIVTWLGLPKRAYRFLSAGCVEIAP